MNQSEKSYFDALKTAYWVEFDRHPILMGLSGPGFVIAFTIHYFMRRRNL